MKKTLLVLMLALPLVVNAAVVSVMDSLFSKGMKGLDNVLVKHSLDGVSGGKIKSSILASLEALSSVDGKMVGHKQLATILDATPSSDSEIFRLKKLLAKNVDELDANEVGELVNGLTYIAMRKGGNKAKLLTCDLCTGDTLAAIGVKNIGRIPQKGTTASKLISVTPINDTALSRVLKVKFAKHKLGNFAEQSVGKITKSRKRSLALFLGYAERGTAEEKRLAKAIIAFSKDDGGRPLLLKNNKLWSIFDYIPEKKMGKEKRQHFLAQFSAMLEEIADEKPIDGSRNNNLKRFLERRVKEEPSLQKYLDEFNSRSLPCWGL